MKNFIRGLIFSNFYVQIIVSYLFVFFYFFSNKNKINIKYINNYYVLLILPTMKTCLIFFIMIMQPAFITFHHLRLGRWIWFDAWDFFTATYTRLIF
jgi:hypothetical protein